MMQPDAPVGICTASHYNETLKAIRFTLKFENGREFGFEWPITMFKFPSGSDKDEEMRKTAKLMHGKKLAWKINKEGKDGTEAT